MSLRIAVTGVQGQIARALHAAASTEADIVLLGRPDLDLAAPATVAPALRGAAPDIIINAAAYTAVDKAESEPDAAFAINEHGARAVAEAAALSDTPLIQLSTDYVFDGRKRAPYVEADAANPINVYGASKLAGERAVASAQPRHAVVRVAWVHGPHGANFVRTMLRLAQTEDEIAVVADQIGRPMAASRIAEALIQIADNLAAAPTEDQFGLFHLGGEGEASWADFAEAVFETAARFNVKTARVRRIATADRATAALRPLYGVMDGGKLAAAHGARLPPWRDGVAESVAQLLRAGQLGG